jgi:hypothetical protein
MQTSFGTLHRIASALLVVLLTAGCASGTPPPTVGPVPSDTVWDSTSDAGAIAAWALQRCREVLRTSAGCVERALGSVLETAGVAKAMEALDRAVERDGVVRREAHGTAHALGIAAYRSPETVGATFAACPPTQMSGCYHGVIQGFFLDLQRRHGGVTAPVLDALCEEQRGRGWFLFFQCAHGMGHGLMALHGHLLPDALRSCDLAGDPFVRESCYGGVFMENIVFFTHPHHTAEAHAEAGGHGGHAAGGATSADHAHAGGSGEGHEGHAGHGSGPAAPTSKPEDWRPVRRGDPLYPCTALEARYHAACYSNHTSALLYVNGGSFRGAARACGRAPGEMARVCWMSLGRDATAYARRQHGRALRLCRGAGNEGEPWCLAGVAENLVNLAADPAEGLRFCRAVEGEANKVPCYAAVGKMVHGLAPDAARREALCAAAEPAHVESCRAGALLPRRTSGG